MENDFLAQWVAKQTSPNSDEQVLIPKKMEETEFYNYGIDVLGFHLMSNDYGWKRKPFKKVTLVNARACEEKINVLDVASAWRGTGHSEWEFLLAGWFVLAVLEAIQKNEEEADISNLFNHDLNASWGRVFPQEKIYNHIINWFDFVSETPDELKLSVRMC